jgi:predicted  nucleic acid-binding Zn-ribbon protein
VRPFLPHLHTRARATAPALPLLQFLQQQEYDGLRQQLQDRQTRITSLETELRLLQHQLSEAKADQRQDKQLAEQRLQESLVHRDEAARQRTQVGPSGDGRG